MTTLQLINLTKAYKPGAAAVRDLNLTVEAGELLVLLGPSGCGKTTTLRLIAGLIQPTAGDLRFNGRSVLTLPPEKRKAVMVFQSHLLFPFMSVGENVAFGLKVQGLSQTVIQQKVAEALTAVQLPGFASRWPDQLSGGQQQRVALARALVVRPQILLLDEPLSNLDPGLREELRGMIGRLQKEVGITTILVTHDQREAVAMGDRIALLINGRLQQVGPPRDFYERPANTQVARFFGGVNFLAGIKQGNIVQTKIGPVKVSASPLPDGDVLLTIRPEAIEIGTNSHNNITTHIQSYNYQGLSAHCVAGINGIALHIATPPYQTYRPGETITIHLPAERIRLLPLPSQQNEGDSA